MEYFHFQYIYVTLSATSIFLLKTIKLIKLLLTLYPSITLKHKKLEFHKTEQTYKDHDAVTCQVKSVCYMDPRTAKENWTRSACGWSRTPVVMQTMK